MKNTLKNSKGRMATLLLCSAIAFTGFMTSCGGGSAKPVKVIDAPLEAVARTMNSSCPMTLDSDTRLDSVSVPKRNNLKYMYTLLNVALEDVQVEEFESIMIPMVQNSYNTHPDLEEFRVKNTTLSYQYYDKNGKVVSEFDVDYPAK